MEIGGLANHNLDAVFGNTIEGVASDCEATLGLGIDRNCALAAGCRCAAARLGNNQTADLFASITDYMRRSTYGCRNQLEIDHHQPKVFAAKTRFDQDTVAYRARIRDCGLGIFNCVDPDSNSAPLFAPSGLYDHALMFLEESFQHFIIIARNYLLRN